ncbi:CobW family GTP-binding protein [Allorhizobium taibaishanense]|uniref:Cobalamin biosynthesis protein CobW n=1 Tax=Allorhizobium taibaishanense TaxID=887144 RepID=A0A1Q9A5Y8_9HYPH|nr:GTP-binding protein [Allorhizobium taibaishanense]MBB4008902.1 G3E family GTPase [Allorhizobium taibaishanense]OLP49993.1 cobalamin biosynthesis protein CobW [Allorhizobium taibaishanense]
MADIPQFTPVNLLTGFLGSGKTTLLKRLLADPALAETAVLINEFGEIGLDHDLVETVDGDTVLLQSGCVCCTIRGDLADAVRTLHERRERGEIAPFRRVVIESTGLADPFPILSTLKADPVLRHHFRHGNVITTVDAVNGLAQLDTYGESARQVAIADRLVVTKTDMAEAAGQGNLAARLSAINPDAALVLAADADFAPARLLDDDASQRGDILQSASGFYCESPEETGHSGDFRSFVVTVDRPVDWTGFGLWLTMLLNRHGARVIRVKGILNIAGEERPVAIHGVQHLVHPPVHMAGWPSDDRRSRLVFIVDGLDTALIRRSFEAFAIK